MQSEYESFAKSIRQCSACPFRDPEIEPLPPALSPVPVAIMFIGENPSWARGQNTPFATTTLSGQALDNNYLQPLNLSRDEVWITDLFKCRYPKRIYNEKAQHDSEIQKVAKACSELWLFHEIEYASPKVIVTLSDREVYQRLRRAFALPIPRVFGEAVGKPHHVTLGVFPVTLFPMVHPDISRPLGQGDQRKMNARTKWAEIHRREHIPALTEVILT